MRSLSGVVMVVAFFVCAVAGTAAADKNKNKSKAFGVGFVPHMNAGDAAEKMLHRFVGEMPEVDQMFNINDGTHMLKTLVKLKKQGKKLDFLVLAGHGSRDTPGMKWAKDDMIPEEIDVAWQRDQLGIAMRMRASKGLSKERIKYYDGEIRTRSEYVKLLEAVPGVMKPDGVVMMINCSAAATDKGKHYVNAFGSLLLGAGGGRIIASANDITLREVEDIYDQVGELFRTGSLKEWGDPYADGMWVTFPIRRGSNATNDAPPGGTGVHIYAVNTSGWSLYIGPPSEVDKRAGRSIPDGGPGDDPIEVKLLTTNPPSFADRAAALAFLRGKVTKGKSSHWTGQWVVYDGTEYRSLHVPEVLTGL